MSKRPRSLDDDDKSGSDEKKDKFKSKNEREGESEQENKQKRARVVSSVEIEKKQQLSPSLSHSPWSRLPSVLLEKICQHKNSCQQHAQFAMTCKAFQNAAKKPGSWHGHFNIVSKRDKVSDPQLFKLYLYDRYMLFDGRFTMSSQIETDIKTRVDTINRIKVISQALSGVKVFTFELEPVGLWDASDFFVNLFQRLNLNFKYVEEVIMEAPFDVVALYSAAAKGECKKLTRLTMSADLYSSPVQIRNVYSTLVKSLKSLKLGAPVLDGDELGIVKRTDEMKITKPAELPKLESLFLESIYMESETTTKFNLFRLASCKRLSKLTLLNCSFQSPQDLLSVASTLKTLIIKKSEESNVPTDENMTEIIRNARNITELDLELSDTLNRSISIDIFAAISSLVHLQKLVMSEVDLEHADFSNMPSLTSLDVTGDIDVDAIVFPTSLKELMWRSDEDGDSKKVIWALPSCPNLEYLELVDPVFPFNLNGDYFQTLTKLNTLVISGTISINYAIQEWELTENGFFNLPKSLVHLELYNTRNSFEEDDEDDDNNGFDQPNKIVLEFIKSAIECKCPIVHLVTDHNTNAVLNVMRQSAQSQKWILPIKRWETFWSAYESKNMSINFDDGSFLMKEMKTLEQVKITYNSYKTNLDVERFMQFLPSSVTTLEFTSQHDPMLLSDTEKQINIDKPELANRHLIHIAKSILKLEPAKLPKLSSIKLSIKFNLETERIKVGLNGFIEGFLLEMLLRWNWLRRESIEFIKETKVS